MKISHRKITASRQAIKIPAPFDEFYRIASDEEVAEYSGYEGDSYPVEETPGYDFRHIVWAVPKDEYWDALADQGIEYVELAQEGDSAPELVYSAGDSVYYVSEYDLELAGIMNERDIEESTDVTSAVDTGLDYWYYSRHGMGPGTIPSGVQVLDWYEEGYKTWMKLDKMLTTAELNDYELKEQFPPEGAITHNGEEIQGCSDVTGSDEVSTFYKGINRGPKFYGDIERFQNTCYDGEFVDSYDLKTRLSGLCNCVGYSDDEEGHYWRAFCDENWEKVKNLSNEEIYAKYPPSPYYDQLKSSCAAAGIDIEGATLEEMQKAMEEYTSKVDQAGKQLDDLQEDMIQKAQGKKKGLFSKLRKKSANAASNIRKVAEDDTTISYVISSDDVEDNEDFMDQPEQEYSSAETAINGKQGKLPAVFSKANIPNGALVLDYGGGTVESEAVAQNYLDQFNAKEMLYDPFNQTAEHNNAVIKELRSNGGADVAVCSNVLNVIKEEEVRLDLLKKIAKLLKPNAIAYISVYEGNGKDSGGATQKGRSYQNNRKLGGYLEEVQTIFPEATRKGAVIIAPNTGVAASTKVCLSTRIADIDDAILKKEIEEGCIDYLCGPAGGFQRPGQPRQDMWDMFADEIFVVEVRREVDYIVVEVRAELSYSGMDAMSVVLDEIVQQYDEDAYFEQVEPGIMECYIYDSDSDIEGATDIKAGRFDSYNDKVIRREEDRRLTPPEYPDLEEEYEPVSSTFVFDIEVTVDDDYMWDITEGDPLYHADILDDYGIDEDEMQDNFRDLIEWNIPSDPGKYALKGNAKLTYESENLDGKYSFAPYLSKITDLVTTTVGKVESSTEVVEATMSEEELDRAILEGKPFDLESFKKWKNPTNANAVQAQEVKVGDVIDIEEDASEVNLGTAVKILAINDPAEGWIDYTFRCEVVEDPGGMQNVYEGAIIDLHFDEGDPIGYLIAD